MAELRRDPITGRWVIVSTVRGKRPASFLTHAKKDKTSKATCPFCPGNEKMTPPEILADRDEDLDANSEGWTSRVIPNKFPALGIDCEFEKKGVGMYDLMSGYGAHEVIIDSADHTKCTKDLTIEEMKSFLSACQHRIEDLYKDEKIKFVLVFKNEGQNAGATLEHTHCQLIATPVTPKRVIEELDGAADYYKQKERCIFCDMISQEKDVQKRIVFENEEFIAFCPYASRFPFEIALLPKNHNADFYTDKDNLESFSYAMKIVMMKLARILDNPQYNFLIHAAPNITNKRGSWHNVKEAYHWHVEIIPRIVKLAGFEWGTGFYINPTSPEDAAKYLRDVKVSI